MKEREYCFAVKNINRVIEYLESENFELVLNCHQIRTIYRNKNNTMARITENETEAGMEILLDFKENKLTDSPLNVRNESLALPVTDMEAVLSILNFLEYEKDNVLIRERKTYKKNGVICEIDCYISPNANNVVSIEGENFAEVDKLYEILKEF